MALILLFFEAVHLPFTTTARLAGFGQINGADLTLSDKRCTIVKRQLSAAGMPDRLQCIGEETIAVNTPSGKEFTENPGVLKNVMILSRVGAEYFIEISKGPHIPNVDKNAPVTTSVTNLSSLPAEKEQDRKDVPIEKEEVVRLSIPKADADELVPFTRTLSAREAAKYR